MALPRYNEWLSSDKLTLIQGWARDGLTEVQIANNMGISIRTLSYWKRKEECLPILQALKSGKEVVDFAVENALLKQAMDGNVTAQIFWLKNRKPDKWRDKPKETNITIEDDGLIKALFASEEDWSDTE